MIAAEFENSPPVVAPKPNTPEGFPSPTAPPILSPPNAFEAADLPASAGGAPAGVVDDANNGLAGVPCEVRGDVLDGGNSEETGCVLFAPAPPNSAAVPPAPLCPKPLALVPNSPPVCGALVDMDVAGDGAELACVLPTLANKLPAAGVVEVVLPNREEVAGLAAAPPKRPPADPDEVCPKRLPEAVGVSAEPLVPASDVEFMLPNSPPPPVCALPPVAPAAVELLREKGEVPVGLAAFAKRPAADGADDVLDCPGVAPKLKLPAMSRYARYGAMRKLPVSMGFTRVADDPWTD